MKQNGTVVAVVAVVEYTVLRDLETGGFIVARVTKEYLTKYQSIGDAWWDVYERQMAELEAR